MSVRTSADLTRPIGVGVLAGLAVLAMQPWTAVPSVRVGAAPLVASAIGTVVGLVYLEVRGDAGERFAATWDELAEEVDR